MIFILRPFHRLWGWGRCELGWFERPCGFLDSTAPPGGPSRGVLYLRSLRCAVCGRVERVEVSKFSGGGSPGGFL